MYLRILSPVLAHTEYRLSGREAGGGGGGGRGHGGGLCTSCKQTEPLIDTEKLFGSGICICDT